jgi:hypothetical protein
MPAVVRLRPTATALLDELRTSTVAKQFLDNVIANVKASAAMTEGNLVLAAASAYIVAKTMDNANQMAGVPSDLTTVTVITTGDIGMAVAEPNASTIATAAASIITGFRGHGVHQAISRDNHGVNEWAILDTVKNPVKTIPQKNGTTKYIGNNAVVVLNEAKKVVTTWVKNHRAWRY